MSGIKQHHIPQIFLRAFKTPKETKIPQVMVFRKDKAFPSSIEGVAAERHFYSKPSADGSQTLDDIITNYELKFGKLLKSLRDLRPGDPANASVAAEVVGHLTIRNAHLRRTISSGMAILLDHAASIFCNEATLRSILGVDQNEFPSNILEVLNQRIADEPRVAPSGLPEQVMHRIAFVAMRENFNRSVLELLPIFKQTLENFGETAPEHIRRSHNEALSEGLAQDGRTKALANLDWMIINACAEGAILPDCVALGVDIGNAPQPLISTDVNNVNHVMMPLTPELILLGRRRHSAIPDMSSFNAAAAAASDNFFVSHRSGSDLDLIAKTIGSRSQEELEKTITSVFEGFRAQHKIETSPKPETNSSTGSTGPINTEETAWSASFHGIASEETAKQITDILRAIIVELRQLMPLDRLDGFTFAHDYDAALRNLNRGFEAKPLHPTKQEYGVGVAMTPLVLREGVVKTHVVSRMSIALGLIAEDDDTLRLAIHTIIQQLAFVSCHQLFDEALPGISLSKIHNSFESLIYPSVDSAWSSYFAARASAIFDPTIGDGYKDLFAASIRQALKTIPQARLAYRYDGNIDQLISVALLETRDVLRFGAQLLGHLDGLRRDRFDDQELSDLLDENGLKSWFELYQADLELIWNRRGRWESFDEFLKFGRHAERILWQFGIFPWVTPEGLSRVEVPLQTDADRLAGIKPALKYILMRPLVAWKKILRSAKRQKA